MLLILESYFVQIVFAFGFVILCGMVISFCNKCFYDACGDAAFGIVRVTGFIGTPVHELSHALMCVLFGHTITKMKLVNADRRSKTLGYVEHTYYKTNLYHQIGNYFIGISPILAAGRGAVAFCLDFYAGYALGYNGTDKRCSWLGKRSAFTCRYVEGIIP